MTGPDNIFVPQLTEAEQVIITLMSFLSRLSGITQRSNIQILKVGGIYFGYYLALGSFMPYINLYFQRLGMSGTEIGMVTALQVIVLTATTLSWGALADRYRIHKWIMCVALFLTPLAILMVSRSSEFDEIVVWMLVFAFFTSPIVPLIDSLAVDVAQTRGGSFGGARVWGSIGYSISSIVIGSLVENRDIRILFYGYAVFMWLGFLIALFQPKRMLQAPRMSFATHFRGFLRLDLILFLLSAFLLATSFSAVNSFFSIYMDWIEAGESLIGLAWSAGAWMEIPMMLLTGVLIKKFGSTKVLSASFMLFALRWLLYSYIRQPEIALAVQLLHGVSFSLYMVASVAFVSQKAPIGLGATAQALLNMATWGLGSIVGSLAGGYTYEQYGLPVMFRVLFGFAIAGLLLFLVSSRLGKESGTPAAVEVKVD